MFPLALMQGSFAHLRGLTTEVLVKLGAKLLKGAGDLFISSHRFTSCPGSELSEGQIRALWEFRTGVLKLKTQTDEAQDWSWFKGQLFSADQVTCIYERGGKPAGLFICHCEYQVLDGKKSLVVFPEFGTLKPSLRGSQIGNLATLLFLFDLLKTSDWYSPVYVGGVAYPVSYCFFLRLCEFVWLDGEDGVPPEIQSLITKRLGLQGKKYDAASRICAMATIPPKLNAYLADSEPVRNYEKIVPNWEEGYGCFMLGRANIAILGRLVGAGLRRWRRRVVAARNS